MLDLGASELLLIVVVAIVVIGPKDIPLAMRTAGRWIGKVRRVSNHFRAGLETMVREAEMEEMEKKWAAQNKKIMEEHPAEEVSAMIAEGGTPPGAEKAAGSAEAGAEAAGKKAGGDTPAGKSGKSDAGHAEKASDQEPQLPLDGTPTKK